MVYIKFSYTQLYFRHRNWSIDKRNKNTYNTINSRKQNSCKAKMPVFPEARHVSKAAAFRAGYSSMIPEWDLSKRDINVCISCILGAPQVGTTVEQGVHEKLTGTVPSGGHKGGVSSYHCGPQ